MGWFSTLIYALVLAVMPTSALAGERPIEITWPDLVPEEKKQSAIKDTKPGLTAFFAGARKPISTKDAAPVTAEYNGKDVRLAGYVVPLDVDGNQVSTFLLVPYVGACIHVPPPPSNQIVLVNTAKPYTVNGEFDAVFVTGRFATVSTSTKLADTGYVINARSIQKFGFLRR